ncbi:MAG: enoyl-CoA hydratase [Acidimicrobiaceae bacterium]|jgi:2-(1,2-epoxy-1,2-dihydrophenyl)acetyl-CoA isomerase|nr:enoyl-CoA hydratase [Acidimicrobiaceae bacterium]|tara:strand:+ start:1214 stop:2002 length:789 start_codon:yes stop_codon:yes gene_type:complete
MELETIDYEVSDGVGHVRLARPAGANAVNPQFSRDLRDVMLEIEWDDAVKAVSVTAEGKIFCAGGDLKEFNQAGAGLPKLTSRMLTDFHGGIYKMNRMPKPFVAGVNGAAGGAGLSIVSAFDLVVAGESAKFTMAYTRAGVTPDGTSTYFVARHIGVRRMLDLTLTNRVLSAEEAEAWGLVNRIVPDDEVDTATAELAQSLADGPSWALGHAKQIVYAGFDSPLEQAGELEGVTIAAAMGTHDGREGIAAFVEKRSPNFIGE